jgi:hypothetical protein
VRVVEHAVAEAESQFQDGGVAAEVLVGQEDDPLAALERPPERPLGVRRRAHRAAVAPDEALDVGRGVHVRDRHRAAGQPELGDPVPGGLDLAEHRHVGHRAAGGEVGQDHALRGAGEDVGRLGHEVHAAEHDELGLGAGRGVAGQLERVARDVGELDDLVALVVVTEDEQAIAERGLGGGGAGHEVGVAGGREFARTVDAPLASGVATPAEQQQGGGGGRRLSKAHVDNNCMIRSPYSRPGAVT